MEEEFEEEEDELTESEDELETSKDDPEWIKTPMVRKRPNVSKKRKK